MNDFRFLSRSLYGLRNSSFVALMACSLGATPAIAASYEASAVEATQQTTTVKGTVVDKESLPIIGATVLVEGTQTGVITDIDGNFSIDVPKGQGKLIISYIGYSPVTVALNGRTQINVTLFEESVNLQEVVVVGYNTVKRNQLTGSVDLVKSDKIASQTSATLEDRLQGKVAGLMISTGSGQPGSNDVKIRIRGTGSINGSNTPLYILDGVMIEAAQFASLNNDDIADIQVLKDASATAIYGSRGANGVIVITSKRGKEGRTQVSYNLKVGSSIMRDPKTRMMTGAENVLYQTYCVEASPNSTSFPLMRLLGLEIKEKNGTISQSELSELNAGRGRLQSARSTDTDYLDEMTQNGFLMEHSLSINGGNEKTKFFISGSFLDQDGVLKKSAMKRYAGRFNIDHKLNKLVDFGVRASVGYADSDFSDPDTGSPYRISYQNPWFTALLAYPYEDPKTWFNGDNPTLITKYFDQKKGLLRLVGSAYVNVNITDWLRFKTNFGIDYYNVKTRATLDREHPKASQNHGYMDQATSDTRRYTWTNTLNFMKTFNEIHALSGVAGFELFDGTYYGFNQRGYDLDPYMKDSPAGIGDKTGASKFPPTIGGSRTRSNLLSLFTQWNYTLKDRYNFSASLRYDESSKFIGSNKDAIFWSVGAAWDLSREEFMSQFKKIDQLKVRASYGTTGNQDGIGDFVTSNGYSKTSYNGQSGYYHSVLGNNNLKWETSAQFDLGADLRMFGHRLNVSADFYVKNTKDLLMSKTISQTSGYGSIYTNAGSIRNTGVELAVSGTPIRTADFEWNIGANITFNKNKITDLGAWANEDNRFINGDVLYEVGKALGTWCMVEWAGVNPQTGEVWFYDQKGGKTENIAEAPVVDKFKSSEVPIFGGFDTSLSYKGFSLSANFTYALDYYIMNASRWYVDNHNFNGNKPAYMLTMWRQPGDVTNVPRFGAKNNPSPWASQFLEDASFLKLKVVRLGWTPSRKLLSKQKIFQSINLFAQAENVFTITDYRGMDPETSGSQDLMSYPTPLTLTFGATINF